MLDFLEPIPLPSAEFQLVVPSLPGIVEQVQAWTGPDLLAADILTFFGSL